ncbi:YcjX family protein [Phaeobacter gallaeciensis]|uniref:YcjX family protein n=1 Tax=Phaeobacter gallaeciensis TaxID=60890 RepID=UPI00237F847A|nr:YcjX family protein [Phaeobacter gallaeciensis]MDE4097029.1 YcjX family protein [Phaeobacter gallaeciensis]MDE4105677.1 YcjX family protein [Phaeobacter gallaeciensis]MDE4110296.1 YcjX family protein [Phaeobacter gallaeciensis]MDE4114764.1 YcjX family protein [Phaeobacter gallaeciensis]MDE4119069.1 YcjX family protein [Phaeobacter gallaeciensis]
MVLTSLADSAARRVEALGSSLSETFLEPSLRLGVTGLARAGKTVFITSLVANLMNRGRMVQLSAARDGRIETAYLQPQPDDTVPRFDYESHLAALTGADPHWPDSTRAVSELRLSLKVRPSGLLAGLQGPRVLHLDIVDYPGEWLLDLALLDKSFDQWSGEVLARIAGREEAQGFRAAAGATDAHAAHDEGQAQALAASFTEYLNAARNAGFYDCTPGRFLLPGDLAGSPVLTFAPLAAREGSPPRGSLRREMARRYEAYKARVVKPFFRDHFSRIDRQVVLVDALGAIHSGPPAVEDLRQSMADILGAFRPGRNRFLTRILGGKRVEKILFAATKADHLHHVQHPQLTAIIEALTREAQDRARFAGAETAALSLASLRTTTEEMRAHQGQELPCVRGTLLEGGRQAAFYPGALPEDPGKLLTPARQGAERWLEGDYQSMAFAPAPLSLRPGDGLPHIRLDRAAEFLIGDRL